MQSNYEDIPLKKKLEELNELNISLQEQLDTKTRELEKYTSEFESINKNLLRQELYLKKSQEIAHIGVWESDIKNDTLYWSDEIYNIFGLNKEEFEPSYEAFLSYVHIDDRDMLDSEYLASIIEKREYFIVHRVVRDDGSILYVEERGTHTYNEDGEVETTTGIVLDITQRNYLEMELLSINKGLDKRIVDEVEKNRLQEQQLIQQSRLAQMGELISMIAHQWRQPLSVIAIMAMNMKVSIELEEYDSTTKEGQEKQKQYFLKKLTSIDGFVKTLTSTIDDFRNFYKPNKQLVTNNLEDVCTKSLNIIKASLESDGVEIVYKYNSHQDIEMYDNELRHVVLNIFKNAQDNFKEKKIKSPKITIQTQDHSLQICDNGGGVPEDSTEKIFDPYFSTKDEKNGTGLGLYMSKIIVEEHHKGKIYVENTNDGACFVIQL